MLNEKDSTPLYVQLYQLILGHILKGEWEQDFKLPSEAELCQQYGVSRMTVRLAMDKLKDQGYLKRKQGQGTFVTTPPVEQKLNSFYSFSDSLAQGGQKVTSRVIGFSEVSPKEYVAEKLMIDEDTKVYCVERIRSIGELPFAYEKSYIPVVVCPTLTSCSIEEHGLYNTLLREGLHSPDCAYETFEAVSMDAQTAKNLLDKVGRPAMRIERIAKEKELCMEFCVSIVRGDRMKYNVILPR